MIEIAGKRWRNLQEQVAWLTAMIGQATDVVKNVQGTVAAAADLPDASTFSNGTTYAVGSASPYEYYVAINGAWLNIGAFPQAGPAGADGVNGVSIFMTSFPTTSATTAIPVISVYNPDGRPVVHGLILSEQGDVFVVTAVNSIGTYDVTYRCSIKGPQGAQGAPGAAGAPGAQGPAGADGADGAPGADGATWKAGSAVIHVDGSGGAFVIPVSSYPGAKVGDFYLSTTTYTSDGFTINKGDVWTITNMTVDGTYGILSKVTNIEGPQGIQGPAGADGADGAPGAPGADGADGAQIILSSATTTSSTTTIDASTMTAELHPPAIGDVVISANGDVFIITGEGAGTLFTVQYGLSIGGSGGVAWGQITGAIADQTDLTNALGQYLPLTGGTMTGNITFPNHGKLYWGTKRVLTGSGNNIEIGVTGTDYIYMHIASGNNVVLDKGNNYVNILDGDNTAANAPLAGTEADLTSLKLNGTTYKVPSGGGGGKLYLHLLKAYTGGGNQTLIYYFSIINKDSTPFTSGTDIVTYILNNILTASTQSMPISGYVYDGAAGASTLYIASRFQNVAGALRLYIITPSASESGQNVTQLYGLADNVIEI